MTITRRHDNLIQSHTCIDFVIIVDDSHWLKISMKHLWISYYIPFLKKITQCRQVEEKEEKEEEAEGETNINHFPYRY